MGAFRARALTHPLNLPPPHRRLPSIPPCHSHAATSTRHPGIVIPAAQRAESWECQHAGLAASILRPWPGQRCLPRPAARLGESALPGEGLAPCHHHGPPAGHRECPPTPQGRLGQRLAPGTYGTLKPIPWLIPHSHSMLPASPFPVYRNSSESPKTPRNSVPSLPPRAWRVPIAPLHQNTSIWHLPHVHKQPCSGWEGAGAGGQPPSSPLCAGAGPGPGADGPSRHGRAAQHGAPGHGKARYSSSGSAALPRPGLPSHTPTRQENLGFPRATCRPCQDCPMSPKPVTRTRADTPQTFLAINRPPLRTALAEPCSLLRSCPPPHPKTTRQCPKTT